MYTNVPASVATQMLLISGVAGSSWALKASMSSYHSCLAEVIKGSEMPSLKISVSRISDNVTRCGSSEAATAATRIPGAIGPQSVCITPSSIGQRLCILFKKIN